jgi:hypothetical protein
MNTMINNFWEFVALILGEKGFPSKSGIISITASNKK